MLFSPKRWQQKQKNLVLIIGLALDGDGDRLIICDENGKVVDGDHIMAICAQEPIIQRKLKKKTLISTVMSNMGLEVAMEKMGGKMVHAGVGDRYVVEQMRINGYNFGGEQSGHLVFLDHINTGDGILAGLQLLAIMKKCKKPLSTLAKVMTSLPQVFKNVRTTRKIAISTIPGFEKAIRNMKQSSAKKVEFLAGHLVLNQ